jgi:hypothetical protein
MSFFTALIGPALGLIGASGQARAGRRAADAQAKANQLAMGGITDASNQARADLNPYANAGGWALGQQQNFLQGDYSAALNSPDYQAALQEGFSGLDRGAASQGNLWGGGMDADRMRLGQNLASQQIGNYYNRLAGMSGQGLGAAQGQAQVGMNAANSIAGLQQDTGMARASSYANAGNAWSNALGQIGGGFGQGFGNSKFSKGGI